MGRINMFGAKAKYLGLFVGVSISVLVWLNMSTREGFQAAPVNAAIPVPLDTISTQKKQDFANAIIQLYHTVIIGNPPVAGVQNVPPMTESSMPTPPMPTPPMPTPPPAVPMTQ
jgi:hypothetical protein